MLLKMEMARSFVLLFCVFFQGTVLVSLARKELSFYRNFPFSNIGHSRSQIDCADCNINEHGFNVGFVYTDSSGAINTFKMNSNEIFSFLNQTKDTSETGQISNSNEEFNNESETNFNYQIQNPGFMDPIKRKRQLLRQKRREKRTMELTQMSKEKELEIQDAAIKRAENFVPKPQDRYSIWRIEYQNPVSDSVLNLMKDQIIMAKVYASICKSKNEYSHYKILLQRIKENQDAIGEAVSDNELHESALERAKAMGNALSIAKDLSSGSTDETERKLRVMLQSSEEKTNLARRQNAFLVQHAAKTVPKPLNCLHLHLTNEYHSLKEDENEIKIKSKSKLNNLSLYHYAIFSDNVLATSVVINSTIFHAKEPNKHVFHVVTDKLNFPAMKTWFEIHAPSFATVQVENIEEFKWLNSSYCSVLRQLESAQLKEYYFKFNHPSSLSVGHENLKYRNPKYLSMLNHLRFYMPEIYPELEKILFLDDDVVVQKDLTPLWELDMKGMVNGAVETCKESFHRFDTYLNFSNPKISENFDPRACGWAFGMNMFDLKMWKKKNITGIYHYWQDSNEDRKLWKLGSLPPGLITFYNLTYPLDRNWHVLGLGYDPAVDIKQIENAGVVHYNGNYKPWLDLAIEKYKPFWSKYVNYDNPYIQRCFMNQ